MGDVDGALEEGEERGEGGGGKEGDGDEGDASPEGGVEKVARDEDKGTVGPRGVCTVREDGKLELWGKVPEGKRGVARLNERLVDCSQLLVVFRALCEAWGRGLRGGGGFGGKCCIDG